jgi:hypothetical protein
VKSKLRVIDRGTRYDVTGNIRRLVRQMESGEVKPRDVVILTTQTIRNNASATVTMHHFGKGSTEDVHWMLATAQNRVEPA